MGRRCRLWFAIAGIALLGFASPNATAQTADQGKLLIAGPLPERSLGDPQAPVTIIEYASLTCHHCANFHTGTWPSFRRKYVDTGKVRFIIREFPLDALAMAAVMLTRCVSDDQWYTLLDRLFQTQDVWSHSKDPATALAQTAREADMTREQFNTCLLNKWLYADIMSVAKRASDEFGVASTPTFFVNGQKHTGALTLEQFDKILEPMLAESAR